MKASVVVAKPTNGIMAAHMMVTDITSNECNTKLELRNE